MYQELSNKAILLCLSTRTTRIKVFKKVCCLWEYKSRKQNPVKEVIRVILDKEKWLPTKCTRVLAREVVEFISSSFKGLFCTNNGGNGNPRIIVSITLDCVVISQKGVVVVGTFISSDKIPSIKRFIVHSVVLYLICFCLLVI